MSSYGFDRLTPEGRDAGPPSSAGGVTQSTFDANGSVCTKTLGSPQIGSWICEHRRDAIAAMVAFRKATVGAKLMNFTTINANANRIAFAREGKGWVAINLGAQLAINATNMTLPAGDYCNVAQYAYTPAQGATPATCSGPPIAVTAGGSAALTLPTNGAVVLHVGATM
jgi:alpha-amylase